MARASAPGLFVALLLAWPSSAAGDAGVRRGVVLSASDPADPANGSALDAVRAHLTGLAVDVRDAAVAEARDDASGLPCATRDEGTTLAAVCVQRVRSGEILVYLTEGGGATTLVRRFFPEPGGSAATIEEVAVAVRALVQALLDGGHVGVAAAAPARAGDAHVLAGRLGYVGTLLSTDIGWQSGVDLQALWRVSGPLVVELRYTFFPSVAAAVPGSSAVLTLERHPVDVAAGFVPRGRIVPEAWLGLWADGVHRTTAATGAELSATGDETDWAFGASLAAGVALGVLPGVQVHAVAAADIAFRKATYLVRLGQGPAESFALSLSTVRPRVELGVGVDLW